MVKEKSRCNSMDSKGGANVRAVGIAVNIGKLIEEELRRQGRSVTWFAREIHCDRRNCYDIFSRESIDTTLLLRISLVLNHDFFKDFSNIMSGV